MNRFLPIALAAAATLGLASTAHADETFAFDFVYDVEALQTEDGALEIYEALETAIAAHCETRGGGTPLMNRRLQQSCIEATMDAAIQAFDSPTLIATHTESVRS